MLQRLVYLFPGRTRVRGDPRLVKLLSKDSVLRATPERVPFSLRTDTLDRTDENWFPPLRCCEISN